MPPKLLIFETHPIQYRAPVFQAMQKLAPDNFEVVYASDFSARGYKDEGFGTNFAWDVPLLSGYPHRVLNNETDRLAEHWSGLTAAGVDALVGQLRPAAVLLSSMSYSFTWAAWWAAVRRGIPVWIRMETQDEASERGPLKAIARSLIYRALYSTVSQAFYIGQLSRKHLLRFGVPEKRLIAAHYCTPNPFAAMPNDEKGNRRKATRNQLGIATDSTVVAFFGKLIPKKDPALIMTAVAQLQSQSSCPMAILIVGSGELEDEMRKQADELEFLTGIKTHFVGFINQSRLPDYYLASDLVVLPSRKMGETWGLVINEALQAGCAAVVSDAVGCSRDFGSWPRVRVVPVGDADAMSKAIEELAALPHDFCWADKLIGAYSTDAAARAVVSAIAALRTTSP